MRTSLNAATLRQDLSLAEFIEIAGQTGYEGIELRTAAAIEFVQQHGLAALKAKLAAAGVGLAGFGYPAPLRSTGDDFKAALANLPAACELAASLGIAGGTAVLPFRALEGYQITRAETVARIGQLGTVAAGFKLDIYLEFIGLHAADGLSWGKTLGQTIDICHEVGLANVGLLIDSYHWHLGGSQESDLARIRQGTPILLHINDAPSGAPVTLNDSMRVLPGEGVMDLPAWLRAIRTATGYDGFVSLELFSEELRALEPALAAARAKSALDGVLAQL